MRHNTGMTFLFKIACGLIATASFASLPACKKTGSPGGSGGNHGSAYFFENTEWTGTSHTVSQEYDQPCYLRFNGDSTVSVYSTFAWVLNNSLELIDSTVGHVTKIDQAGGITTIDVDFAQTGDQQEYSIATDEKTLTGGSIASSTAYMTNTFNPHLQRCPATIPPVSGPWSSKTITENGPTQGMYAYPDLQTFSLNDDHTETYYRAGKPITYTPTDHDQILLEHYTQRGPIVYMAGYDESRDLLNGYFGVLSPDGKSMFVNSHASYRLPNYTQTIYWYGPPGVTPIIFKQ